jgi:hypothetical protein
MLSSTTLDEANPSRFRTMSLYQNSIIHSRTKHIDIQHHFLRDHKTKGDIEIRHVSTEKQLVDIFTKPLDESRFLSHAQHGLPTMAE